MNELLHRQVHPNMWMLLEGRPQSSAFRPTPKDQGQLSVARGSKVSADDAYRRFTARGLSSAGAWSVTVGECRTVELTAYDDPLPDDDAHALVDFGKRSGRELERCAKLLLRYALGRPCYRPAREAP